MDVSLNNCRWKLKGHWPNVPLMGRSMESGIELMGVTDWIDATVPGGVHQDLFRAGLIEDPYFEKNSLKCEWVENRWWMYKTEFTIDAVHRGKKLELIFKGIDYNAHFYLNGHKLGEHEGMYEQVIYEITDIVDFEGLNILFVLFECVPDEMGQIGWTSRTKTQKSRFNYKWDFSTRLVNIGIWDDVFVKISGKHVLKDIGISTDLANGAGIIKLSTHITGESGQKCKVRISVEYNYESITSYNKNITFSSGKCRFHKKLVIPNPLLWYPNGMGEHPLYTLKIMLFADDELSDIKEFRVGIRSLRYLPNEGSQGDTLPYTFKINDRLVYIKGVNLTPFDHLYGNVSTDKYDRYIHMVKNANINMVRIWGGGIIEKDYFYDLCDANGIMIWQEFIQSSSGIDNIPSKDVGFLKLLKAASTQAVKTKRTHVSHTVWSGGNELTDEQGIPVTYDNSNIRMLYNIVKKYDPGKLFLPTSASGPTEFLNPEHSGNNHDVHGNWLYEGAEKHYRFYNSSDSLFHSEFGVNGMSCSQSLKKFLGKENLRIADMKSNIVWRHHGELWDTFERDNELFGPFTSLDQFTIASQFIQAEGLRYIVCANRRRQFKNSGSIVWQFNEPWPNVACTSLVTFYEIPKMAYYWLKDAYSPIYASLKYDKLFWNCEEQFNVEIFLHNDFNDRELIVEWKIQDIYGNVLSGNRIQKYMTKDSCIKIEEISLFLPHIDYGIFFLKLLVFDSYGTEQCSNLFAFSQLKQNIYSSLLHYGKCRLRVRSEKESITITNTGDVAGLFIHLADPSCDYRRLFENNYISIFPGEQKKIHMHYYEACGEARDGNSHVELSCLNDYIIEEIEG